MTSTSELRLFSFEPALGEAPGLEDWASGTWTIRIEVNNATNTAATLESCYICRMDGNSTVSTVGSQTGQAKSCTNGVKTWTISGAASSGDATDTFWVLISAKGANTTWNSIQLATGTVFDTPLVDPNVTGTSACELPAITCEADDFVPPPPSLSPRGVLIRGQRAAAATSSGEQEITVQGMNGNRIKACMITVSGGTNDTGTLVSDARLSSGFSNGLGKNYAFSFVSEHNVGTSDTKNVATDNYAVYLLNSTGTGIDAKGTITFDLDKVLIEWDGAPSAAYSMNIIAWGGEDVQVAVGDATPEVTGNADVEI
ncbi:MAG: hypothetical protein ACR2N7_05390, partial [Acidimicrobiia bacterium]